MAQGGNQISALHLAIAAGGGVLLYAALRGTSPLIALKDITSGKPPAVSTEGKRIEGADHQPGGSGGAQWQGSYKRNPMPLIKVPASLIAAANTHAREKYSQSKRWQRGFSDCSSFVGKSLLDIGINPPGNSVTTDYLSSSDWVTVTSPKMGDIAVNSQHMALFTNGSSGIGQQNSRRNVDRGSMDDLMANSGSWQIRRWKGWA